MNRCLTGEHYCAGIWMASEFLGMEPSAAISNSEFCGNSCYKIKKNREESGREPSLVVAAALFEQRSLNGEAHLN